MKSRTHIKLTSEHKRVLENIEALSYPDDYDEELVNDLLFDGYIDKDCGMYFLTPKARAVRRVKNKTF